MHVLIVEDHDDTRNMMAEVLKLDGAEVEKACDPLEALQHLRAHAFDAVVTDLAMPGATGFWLLEQIKKNEAWHDIPVIAVSGSPMLSGAEAAGFAAHVRKPADPFALCATVASVISAQ